jgi:hypothetical protein
MDADTRKMFKLLERARMPVLRFHAGGLGVLAGPERSHPRARRRRGRPRSFDFLICSRYANASAF